MSHRRRRQSVGASPAVVVAAAPAASECGFCNAADESLHMTACPTCAQQFHRECQTLHAITTQHGTVRNWFSESDAKHRGIHPESNTCPNGHMVAAYGSICVSRRQTQSLAIPRGKDVFQFVASLLFLMSYLWLLANVPLAFYPHTAFVLGAVVIFAASWASSLFDNISDEDTANTRFLVCAALVPAYFALHSLHFFTVDPALKWIPTIVYAASVFGETSWVRHGSLLITAIAWGVELPLDGALVNAALALAIGAGIAVLTLLTLVRFTPTYTVVM